MFAQDTAAGVLILIGEEITQEIATSIGNDFDFLEIGVYSLPLVAPRCTVDDFRNELVQMKKKHINGVILFYCGPEVTPMYTDGTMTKNASFNNIITILLEEFQPKDCLMVRNVFVLKNIIATPTVILFLSDHKQKPRLNSTKIELEYDK